LLRSVRKKKTALMGGQKSETCLRKAGILKSQVYEPLDLFKMVDVFLITIPLYQAKKACQVLCAKIKTAHLAM